MYIYFVVYEVTNTRVFADCSADCLASVPDGQCSVADLKPKAPSFGWANFGVGELQRWHLCHPCIALDPVVQFDL